MTPDDTLAMAPAHAAAVLRAYVLTATKDRLGRDLSASARFAAMDACDAIDRLLREVA